MSSLSAAKKSRSAPPLVLLVLLLLLITSILTYIIPAGAFDVDPETGATIAVVTGDPRQKTPALADCVLFVPAAVFNGTDPRAVPSIQPMGNLFEQHIFLLFDMIIMMLEEELQLDHQAMESRHRNVE